MAQKEIKSLTGLRGIAALWVVFLHYIDLSDTNNALFIGLDRLRHNGVVAVDIFFILSALVMCLAYSKTFSAGISFKEYWVFMKKRFIRIYPAYIVWVFMFLLLFDFAIGKFPIFKIVTNALLVQNFFDNVVISAVFWSLCSEWILYLVFPFLFYYIKRINKSIFYWFLIISCILIYTLLPTLSNYAYRLNEGWVLLENNGFVGVTLGVNSILRCFLSYLIGISGYLLACHGFFKNDKTLLVLYIFSLMGLLLMFPVFDKNALSYASLIGFSFLLVMTLYGREHKSGFFNSKVLYYLGEISYSVYLSHMFILIFISIVVKKLLGEQFLENYHSFLVLSSLIAVIPVSHLSYRFIEKRGGQLLRKLVFKNDVNKPRKAW